MQKIKYLLSASKIFFVLLVVGICISASRLPAITGAFVNSMVTAISNSVGAGAWVPPEAPLFWAEEDTNQVKLDWLASASSSATGYKVYRSTDNVVFTPIATLGNVLTYADTTASANTDYYYKVTAIDVLSHESVLADITSKFAGTRDIVIDDDAQAGHFNANGVVAQGGTGSWDRYATLPGAGVNVVPSILQNAVGGDNYSTANPATGQTFSWTTNATLNGEYEVLAQYICDPSRGNAEYQVYSGVSLVSPTITKAQNLFANGTPCGPQGSGNTESHWLSLGTFPITNQGKVVLTAPAGQAYILADAVAFRRVGDIQIPAPVVNIDPAAARIVDGYACGIGSALPDDELKVTVTSWQPTYKLRLRYKIAGGGYNSFADASAYGLSPVVASGTATFEYGNTGNSPAGAAGWQAQVVDATTNVVIPGSNTAEMTYIITNDPNAVACGGTGDDTPPSSLVTVSSSPSKDIINKVLNGDFEAGLTNWTAVGDVALVSGTEHEVTPYGSNMVRIGRDLDTDAKSVDVNILSQPIASGIRSIGFWYNFQTYETGFGFDEPGMMVFVNDKMVHQVWASDIPVPAELHALHGTGWRFLSIDLSQYSNPTLSIAFYAGNTYDLNRQSFIYVDNVTTNEAAVNAAAVFKIDATDNVAVADVHYRYTVGGTPVTGSGSSGLTFSISQQPDNGVIEYWAVDTTGNTEAQHNFHVMYDNAAPAAISDLSVNDDSNGDFVLNWTAPSDSNPYGVDQAAEYDLRYSTSTISSTISDSDWSALPQPAVKNNDGLPGGNLRDPLVAGHNEMYQVHVNNGAGQYWFAVRTKDHAKNISIVSNIATTIEPTVNTSAYRPDDVVINEIMWSTDQWLELRNMTSKDITLTGWVIQNAGSGSTPFALPSGAILPANGFYVIGHETSNIKTAANFIIADLNLDATGEQLILLDNTAQIIDSTPTGVWAFGENGANKRSMERNNVPGDGTMIDDPITHLSSWHSCDSQSCSDARALYWKVVGNDYGTPGGANLSFDETQIQTDVTLQMLDDQHLQFVVNGLQNYTSLTFTLQYDHELDDQVITDAVTGKKTFSLQTRSLTSDEIYLGTCSTDGLVCTPHQNVQDVLLNVILKGEGIVDKILNATLAN